MLRCVILCATAALCAFAQTFVLEGDWDSEIDLPSEKTRFVIRITKTGPSYAATFDNDDAGVRGLPIRDVILEAATVKFEIVPAKGKFTGMFTEDGTSIIGNVALSTGEFPMRMRRAKVIRTEGADEPRAITQRGLENLEAFARLFGYVRHFHPSDGVRRTDWNEFAVHYASAAEAASNPVELAHLLRNAFGPIAPGVRIWPTGDDEPAIANTRAKELVSWRHHGFGDNRTSGIYRTELQRNGYDAGKHIELRKSLPGGVDVAVPVQVPSDGSVTLPSSTAWRSSQELRRSGNARGTRLGSVIMTWNIMQHFYPYFDVVDTDWGAVLPKALQRAATDANEMQFLATLRWMPVELKDGHGAVRLESEPPRFTPDVLWEVVDGRLVITWAGPELSVKPGDVVLTLAGKPAMEALGDAEAVSTGATPQLKRYRALRLLGSAAKGTLLKAEIEPYGENVQRRTVDLICTTPSALRREPRPDKVTELRPGIWYVDWTRISNEDFQQNLPKLAEARGIVFDVRGYPSFQSPSKIFQHLLPSGGTSPQWHVPVIERPDREGMTFDRSNWQIQTAQPLLRGKKVFLTDGRAISYAESCMGIVEHYKLGEIIGQSTAGTNGNVISIRLPGDYTFAWTGMKVLKHDGSRHHGVGILATVPVNRTRAGIAGGKDEVLERGLQALEP
ncbi:MAG TPA: S41 family peptidase [Bryobacteraceae bacterium]|nr:S41 family peptidase [Bryobacteraceae bacterium]